jgi:hypothetical protein
MQVFGVLHSALVHRDMEGKGLLIAWIASMVLVTIKEAHPTSLFYVKHHKCTIKLKCTIDATY